MATVLTATGTRPAEFIIPFDSYWTHNVAAQPRYKNTSLSEFRLGFGLVSAAALIASTNFMDWTDVNPRLPKRLLSGQLTGHVIKAIRETLLTAPETFLCKNHGLDVIVDRLGEYKRNSVDGSGSLPILLSKLPKHGICNGLHTYALLRDLGAMSEEPVGEDKEHDTEEQAEERERLRNALRLATVRVALYENVPPAMVVDMVEGLNRTRQVDEAGLMNMANAFEDIRNVMAGHPGHDEIGYYQNDGGEYYITDIVRIILLFDCNKFHHCGVEVQDGEMERHPSGLYRQPTQALRLYDEELSEIDSNGKPRRSPVSAIMPHLPEILQLMDHIALLTPDVARKLKFAYGNMLESKLTAGKAAPLCFINRTMDRLVPTGWLHVMLSAFRANVDWSPRSKQFNWFVPLDALLPRVITGLVGVCVAYFAHEHIRPDDLGRKHSAYKDAYAVVEKAVAKYLKTHA